MSFTIRITGAYACANLGGIPNPLDVMLSTLYANGKSLLGTPNNLSICISFVSAGIGSERIVFDPGIGFGKSLSHNLELLNRVEDYRVHDRPILMGLSRKSFIGQLLGDPEMSRREFSSQALTAFSRQRGAMIHRVHQVREAVQVLRMTEAVLGS